MQRRGLLQRAAALTWPALAAGSGLGFTGCGFALRQAPVAYSFDSLLMSPAGSTLTIELARALAASSTTRMVTDPAQLGPRGVLLDVLREQREKAVAGLNAAGQVREFELRLLVTFRLRSARGAELIPDTEMVQRRDISYTESVALAKEAEEQLLYRDMQSEIVRQLLRRLAAVSPPN